MVIFSKKEIRCLAQAGGQAPSGGNAQPWIIHFRDNSIDIFLDPARSNSFLDAKQSASVFAIGCFLQNILITLRYLGYLSTHTISDHNTNKKPLVTIQTTSRYTPTEKDKTLFQAISQRHTNRKLFDGRIISANIISSLFSEAQSVSSSMRFYEVHRQHEKNDVATILGRADELRIQHDELFSEMMQEFRWTQEEAESRDGLELPTLELPYNVAEQLKLLKEFPFMRSIIPSQAFRNLARPLLVNTSHLVCISAPDTTVRSIMSAGRAMEQLWLQATINGLSIQPWSVIVFYSMRLRLLQGAGFSKSEQKLIRELEKQLHRSFNIPSKRTLIFLFRLSYSSPPSAVSKKRSWKDFTRIYS